MKTKKTEKSETRPVYEIAREIIHDWKNPFYGAAPYLEAMLYLRTPEDNYGFDSGNMIIRYFLSNAATWKGETARRIKKELKSMI